MASDDYSIKTRVEADVSNFEKGMNKAEKSLKGFSDKLADGINRLGKKGLVGSIANVTLAMGGLTQSFNTVARFAKNVGKAINDCTEAYKSQIIAEKALTTAVENNPLMSKSSVDSLKKFASEMQKVSNYGDEELIPMLTNLVSLGRSEAETMQIMSVAMDMSAGMGISLDTAITQLNATLNGNIGRLGQQNAELKGLTEEELKQGKAIEILGNKFKGLSEATIDTSKQLKNIKGDFKEALGEFTLPSSDMWNRFWTGFYQNGIDVINKFNDYFDSQIIGKRILENLQTNAKAVANATGNTVEDVLSDLRYLKEQLEYLSDSEIRTLNNTLEKQKNRTQAEERMLVITRQIAQSRKLQLVQDQKDAEAKAKEVQDLTEQQEIENGIAELKDKHLKNIKEQEARWENIKKVTGEEVKAEEKLKFYQDDLVAIMTEAGGQISTNNEYYKNQIKIINQLKSALGETEEVTAEIAEDVEEIDFADFFSDLNTSITTVLRNAKNNLYDYEQELKNFKNNFIDGLANNIASTFGNMFASLGESLVDAGYGFEDFASVALKSLSEVLKSISAQLSALAVLKFVTHDYANATIALAGATASMIASGTASAVSKSLTKTKDQIDAVGDSANKAGKDLEYFKKRLEEITSGMTSSSRNLIASISKLKQEWIDVKEKANEAYKAYRESADADPKGIQTIKTYKLQKAYTELQETVDNYFESYKNASKSVLTQLKEEVSESESLVQSYKDIYSSILKYQVARLRWNLMTPEQRKSDKIDYDLRSAFGGDVTKTLYGQLEQYKTYINILLNEQKLSVQNLLTDVYDQLSNTGKNIGDKLVNSIINGAEKADFLGEMKSYIRENLIKIAVYTESFQDKLAEVGMKLASALTEGTSALGAYDMQEVRGELEKLYESASTNATKAEKIIESVFGDIGKTIENTVIEINAVGESIGNTIFNSILNGAKRSDFLLGMKNFMRENLLKLAVYTDEFKYKLKEIGEKIGNALIGDMTEDVVSGLRTEIETLYDSAIKNAKRAENLVSSVFGDIKETVEETVEETLTKFENLMKSFKESVSDVGGEIGQTFVDAIANGMSQGDFLDKMKSWIKRMLVQSVVYTESMKAEIEAIGQAITKGIREGFTETSLHEIRRDLSWVFNEANETVASLDNILDRTFGGYAIGTNNALSGLHLVGEAGPELVRFRGGEQVLNAGNTQKALSEMGGTTINQNVTFNNLQDTTAYAMMNQFKQYNRSLAINGVI